MLERGVPALQDVNEDLFNEDPALMLQMVLEPDRTSSDYRKLSRLASVRRAKIGSDLFILRGELWSALGKPALQTA